MRLFAVYFKVNIFIDYWVPSRTSCWRWVGWLTNRQSGDLTCCRTVDLDIHCR